MKKKTGLVLVELLGGIFGWIWIGASIAAIYYLYGALVEDGPWLYVLWSVVAGFVARTIAAVLSENQRRLDYIDQLREHGYPESEAAAAWRTASGGGFNVLLTLQQAQDRYRGEKAEQAGDSVDLNC